ncbi:MAG: methyltransferase domain-containing protein [Gammaproteobacteria bacterium]|nr:methyltransferase domain-containing protein [Gammaproteobacteria bacterium]
MARKRLPLFVDVAIVGLDEQGRGIGEVQGRRVRVKNALPGERVKARVLKRQRREWLAETALVLMPSSRRKAAPCATFPRCGGCAIQHLAETDQLRHKQRLLLDALQTQGVEPVLVRRPVTGPLYGYRTKARLGVRVVNDEPLIGFRETASNRVVRMDTCLTLAPSLARLLGPLKSLVAALSVKARIPQIEVAAGDVEQAIILRHLDPLSIIDHQTLAVFGEVHQVKVLTQSRRYDDLQLVSPPGGSPLLNYSVPQYGLCFEFHPVDFTQVNLAMNRRLVADTMAALEPVENRCVGDLFCGIGNFSLALARLGAKVVGLEGSAIAVERATINARVNGVAERCEFHVQDLYDFDRPIVLSAQSLLVDPPRTGMGQHVLRSIQKGVMKVVYVSCNPATFAADADRLGELGFSLTEVGVYDMFPNTTHVETLGVFQR